MKRGQVLLKVARYQLKSQPDAIHHQEYVMMISHLPGLKWKMHSDSYLSIYSNHKVSGSYVQIFPELRSYLW